MKEIKGICWFVVALFNGKEDVDEVSAKSEYAAGLKTIAKNKDKMVDIKSVWKADNRPLIDADRLIAEAKVKEARRRGFFRRFFLKENPDGTVYREDT